MKKKLLLSFLIPIGIILSCFLIFGIYPFGDSSIVVIDSNTQYISFINYLKSVIFSTNDLKYTLSASLGENLIPLLGYYMMSPFNLLTVLFSTKYIELGLTIVMLIKLGLCSMVMEYFFRKKYPDKNTLLFSISYSLMSYNIVYIYHTMWFDSIILLPLLILGVDKIFEDKKPTMYIISLALSIIFNYYIGVMMCLGSVIYFAYKFIKDYKLINKFKVFVNYSVSSLFGGLLSLFILLPSLFGLTGSKASFSLSNLKFDILISPLKVLAKTFTASVGPGETWHGGPMIGCGIIMIILLFLYFTNKKISKKDKILDASILLIYLLTFIIEPLDLLFHGLNTPNCFDFRHSFLIVFFIINIALKSYINLDINKRKAKILITSFALFSLIIYLCKFNYLVQTYYLSLIVSFILLIVMTILLLKYKKFTKVLSIVIIIDLIINTGSYIVMLKVADTQSVKDYKKYVTITEESLNKLESLDDSLYRIEKTYDREIDLKMLAINDSMLFNYNGISHFDSTSSKDTEIFLEKLGFRRLLSRAYYNKYGSTVGADMLLGVKYILSDEDNVKDYTLISNDDINIFKNPYSLSLAYAYKNDYKDLTNNPFENLNNIFKNFTGINKDVYIKSDFNKDINNADVIGKTYTPYGMGIITYTIDITSNDTLYFYFPPDKEINTEYQNAKIYLNGSYYTDYFTKYNHGVTSLGKFKVGDTITIKIRFRNELTINDELFYYEDTQTLSNHYNVLYENNINLEKISSSSYYADVNLKEKSNIIFTIPYDAGWNIKVDGKEVIVNKVIDSLLSIQVNAGQHKIELNYSPKYLNIGLIISSIGIIATSIYIMFYKKIWDIYYKYEEIFNYLIIGVLTTVVSLVSYFIFSKVLPIEKSLYFILANTLSWVLAVIFAYITNKIFVFKSNTKGKEAYNEAIKFISSRIFSFLVDIIIMFILVKVLMFSNSLSKLIVQIVVLILNYILSKIIVFKKK